MDDLRKDTTPQEETAPAKTERPKSQMQLIKESWYDKVTLSVRQLDIIIACGILGLILTAIAIAIDVMH